MVDRITPGVERAEEIIKQYAQKGDTDEHGAIRDLLTDLIHYANCKGLGAMAYVYARLLDANKVALEELDLDAIENEEAEHESQGS